MEKLKIEYLPVEALKPYDRNTRKHGMKDIEAIAKSIEKYGFDDPIGVWGADNLIVEGHGRLLAAKRLNMDTVPVIRLDHLTDQQRREYTITHNKTAELSEWDFDALKIEVPELDLSDFDFGIDFLGGEAWEEEHEKNQDEKAVNDLGLTERELEPYRFIHYMVTIETNEHDKFIATIKHLEELGADVKMTRNNT